MFRIRLIVMALALAACAEPRPEAALDLEPCTIQGLPDCVRAGALTFGGQPTADALRLLAARGYRTVISTRGEGELDWDEHALVAGLGMRYVAIPMASPVTSITDSQVAALDAALASEGPTLLHCSSGNRAAGLWGAWLAERRGVDRARALALAEQAGMTRTREVVEARLHGAATR